MKNRLFSLDIFRGVTIAGMILVNNPGSWSHVYPPLLHARWHGATPTDWIFPFFLFIVGVAIPLAIGKRVEKGDSKREIIAKIAIRSCIIFGLGLLLGAFPEFGMVEAKKQLLPWHFVLLGIFLLAILFRGIIHPRLEGFWGKGKNKRRAGMVALAAAIGLTFIGVQAYNFSHLRIPGVLQRIALVYGACALMFLYLSWKNQLILGGIILLGYWAALCLVPIPGGMAPNLEPGTNLAAWVDRTLLGNHLWAQSKTWDPEGILSTFPAIVTGISGVLTGLWLKSEAEDYKKLGGIMGTGVILLALSYIWHLAFPINKALWTSSYVLYTSGIALLFLGVLYWLTDLLGLKKWARPFEWYGKNALIIFVLSGFLARLFYKIKWTGSGGELTTLGGWVYGNGFKPFFSDYNASLAYAIAHVLFFMVLAYFLNRKKVYIKV